MPRGVTRGGLKSAGGRDDKFWEDSGCRIRRWRLPRPGRGVCGFRVNFIPNLLHFSRHSRQSDEIIGIFAGVP